MDPINPLERLNALLRSRVSSDPSVKVRPGDTRSSTQTPLAGRQATPEALRKRIAASIEAISDDDPLRNKKAARTFVENVLTWQFGDALLNDSRFAALVEDVQSTLESDPGFYEALLASMRSDQG